MIPQIKVIQGDITTLHLDAIVNAANSSLLGGGGVDGAIHRAAGLKLLEECRTLGGCKTGEAKMTKGYNLPAKFVIHTVGPIWHGGNHHESDLLKNCYRNSLLLATNQGLHSIAFPAISTGVYGFPFDQASYYAIQTTCEFIEKPTSLREIYFVLFGKNDFEKFTSIFDTFIK